MTRSQLITALWLLTVIFLGSAALLLPERGDDAAEPTGLVPYPPSEVVAVSVQLPDGSAQSLRRLGPDRWNIGLPQAGGGSVDWPASPERVRAFLRILDRLTGIETEPPTTGAATTVAVESTDGQRVAIGLPGSSIGGRAIVEVGSGDTAGHFLTTDELTRLVTARGLLQWLDARAFAAANDRVEGLSVTSTGGTLTIARAGAGWRIEAPFDAPAEPALIDELLNTLRRMPCAEPMTTAGEPGADSTSIVLTTSTRTPGGEGAVSTTTTTHSLATVGPVTESGRIAVRLEAQAGDGTIIAGPIGATVEAAALADSVKGPEFYIARRATQAEPADVRSLSLALPDGSELTVQRTTGGWSDGQNPLPAETAAAIDQLVALLTSTVAVAASHSEGPPTAGQLLAGVTAQGLGGLAIGQAELFVAPLPGAAEDSRAHAALRSGSISRFYAPEAALEAVGWVVGLSPPGP